jgi:hypothetical protein
MWLSTTLQEPIPGVVTSAVPSTKELNAEEVTTMATDFLKRIGHKGSLKPKRVALEEEVYTVEVELKKFTAVVRIGCGSREIKEYDVQPKSEESSFSFSPKLLITISVLSVIITAGLYFGFKMLGL